TFARNEAFAASRCWMSKWKSVLCRYGSALLFSMGACSLILLFDQEFGRLSPFLVFYGAVARSSWLGGSGPGLLATAAGALAGDYWLPEPLWAPPGAAAPGAAV